MRGSQSKASHQQEAHNRCSQVTEAVDIIQTTKASKQRSCIVNVIEATNKMLYISEERTSKASIAAKVVGAITTDKRQLVREKTHMPKTGHCCLEGAHCSNLRDTPNLSSHSLIKEAHSYPYNSHLHCHLPVPLAPLVHLLCPHF